MKKSVLSKLSSATIDGKTVAVRIAEDKEVLLKALREYPVASTACKVAGVGRATYYRWLSEDATFKKQARLALKEGALVVNDIAEDILITMVKDKDLSAIKYWLQFHHEDYSRNGFIPVIYAKGKK